MVKRILNISLDINMQKKIRPLCTFLSKISAHRTEFHGVKYISSLIKNDELLEKFNEFWEKV